VLSVSPKFFSFVLIIKKIKILLLFGFQQRKISFKLNNRLKRLCLILLFIIFRKYISTATQPFSMGNIN
jgi:hypothetical protein